MNKMQRGTTLIEVLIATGILLLLLGMLYNTLIPAIKICYKTEAESTTQQQAILGQSKIFREIIYSNSASLTILKTNEGAGYDAISFISLEAPRTSAPFVSNSILEDTGFDADPIIWRKFVIFFKNKDSNLIMRKEIPCINTTKVMKIRGNFLVSQIEDDKYKSQVVARGAESLKFSTVDYPSVDVDIKTQARYSGKIAQTTLYMKFLPEN